MQKKARKRMVLCFAQSIVNKSVGEKQRQCWLVVKFGLVWALVFVVANLAYVNNLPAHPIAIEKTLNIPILGTSFNTKGEPIGIVIQLEIQFEQRPDHHGLRITFEDQPGALSPFSKQAIIQAVWYAAQIAHLQPDSWDVSLSNTFPGLTIYGDSLSAMVGLSVIALAKGDPLLPGRALTGTITHDGEIGIVGGVPYKIAAAHARRIHRVLIPEEQDVSDGDWQTPFLMQDFSCWHSCESVSSSYRPTTIDIQDGLSLINLFPQNLIHGATLVIENVESLRHVSIASAIESELQCTQGTGVCAKVLHASTQHLGCYR